MAISLRESVYSGFSDFWSRKVRSFITIFGIILGTMSIIVVLSLMKEMNRQSIAWLQERGGLSKITVRRNWEFETKNENVRNFLIYKEVRAIKELIPEALYFSPEIGNWMTLSYEQKSFDGPIRGVLPDFSGIEEWPVSEGRFISEHDIDENNNVIVIGSEAYKELFNSRNPIGKFVSADGQRMQVIGVMKHRFYKSNGMGEDNMLDYLNYRSFIPLTTTIKRFSTDDEIYSFTVKTNNPDKTLELSEKLKAIMLNFTHGKPVFEVESGLERAENVGNDVKIFRVVFLMISMISLFVGGIVIMNIMLATVRERTREIGIRIAVGARRIDIFVQFMVQTVLVTTTGGLLGVALGVSILSYVGKFMEMSLRIEAFVLFTAILVSAGVGVIFGIIPALNASNLDPVKALRYE